MGGRVGRAPGGAGVWDVVVALMIGYPIRFFFLDFSLFLPRVVGFWV